MSRPGRARGRRRSGAAAFVLGLCVCTAASPASADAQVKASEHASVAQTIDGTTISVTYHRPSLRGRDELWGGQIHWGETWTPGANWATILEADKDITLEGHDVPAGRWSVWMVVEEGDWEVVLEPTDSLWHTQPPESSDEQVRFTVTPDRGAQPSLETLTWSFPSVRGSGSELRMQWGTLAVDLDLGVQPTRVTTVTSDEAAPYLGSWDAVVPKSDWQDRHDFVMDIAWSDGHLAGNMEWSPDPVMHSDVIFVPVAEGMFAVSFGINGHLAEVVDQMIFEFEMDDDGRATSFELRDPRDTVMLSGTRRD